MLDEIRRLRSLVEQLNAQMFPFVNLLRSIIKILVIIVPFVVIMFLISFSRNYQIPFPLSASAGSILIFVFSITLAFMCIIAVTIVVYPPASIIAAAGFANISSHYPVFQKSDTCPPSHANKQGWRKIVNYVLLGELTFLLFWPLFAILDIIFTSNDGVFIYTFLACVLFHIILIVVSAMMFSEKMSKYDNRIFPKEINLFTTVFQVVVSAAIANALLFLAVFIMLLLFKTYITQLSESASVCLIYIAIVLCSLLIFSFGLKAAVVLAPVLGILFICIIGISMAAENTLRFLNLGGNTAAQFVVKADGCAILEKFSVVESRQTDKDNNLVSCMSEQVSVVLNVGDAVYFRTHDATKDGEAHVENKGSNVLGIDRKLIIGTITTKN